MFNLYHDTKNESGIIVYEDNAVGVFNWAALGCEDNCLPMLSPFGTPINWLAAADNDDGIVHIGFVDDVREYLPGTVFLEDGKLYTDMDIVYDELDDIPALFGFGPHVESYNGRENPYSGDIWELPGWGKVITIPWWN